LGEPPQLFHGIAFALIVSGIIISSRSRNSQIYSKL